MSIKNFLFVHDNLLIFDANNIYRTPGNFRSTNAILPPTFNTLGFNSLHMSGSAQFSALELKKLLNHDIKAKNVVIVDLRQESHGFINGYAISWAGIKNKANYGKTAQQIEAIQEQYLDFLAQNYSVPITINKVVKKSSLGEITKTEPISLLINSVNSESELIKKIRIGINVNYYRVYVTDHFAPTVAEVNRFVQFAKNLPPNTWLHFHCRAGKGRTSTFMVLYDMLKNAKQVSFTDIMAREILIGSNDLRKLPLSTSYKYHLSAARAQMLKRFYLYSQNNHDNFKTPFI